MWHRGAEFRRIRSAHEISGDLPVPNPFTPDFGTRPAHLATGESLLLKAMLSLASGPRDSGYTRLILGQPGSGKTTILAEIRELARAAGMLALSALWLVAYPTVDGGRWTVVGGRSGWGAFGGGV